MVSPSLPLGGRYAAPKRREPGERTTRFSLLIGDVSARFNADLWLPGADLYLEPHVREDVLTGWLSGAKDTPVLRPTGLDPEPSEEPTWTV